MDLIQAIEYMVDNASTESVYTDSGAWNMTRRIVQEHRDGKSQWNQQELDILLGQAACY